MNRVRYIGAVIVTASVLIFAMQNLEAVPVSLLVWDVSASVALIALAPFLVGLVMGSAATFFRARRARARELKAHDNVEQLGSGEGKHPPPPAQ